MHIFFVTRKESCAGYFFFFQERNKERQRAFHCFLAGVSQVGSFSPGVFFHEILTVTFKERTTYAPSSLPSFLQASSSSTSSCSLTTSPRQRPSQALVGRRARKISTNISNTLRFPKMCRFLITVIGHFWLLSATPIHISSSSSNSFSSPSTSFLHLLLILILILRLHPPSSSSLPDLSLLLLPALVLVFASLFLHISSIFFLQRYGASLVCFLSEPLHKM